MRTLSLAVLLFTTTCAFSQNGRITMSNKPAYPEDQATFLYEPPLGLNLPREIQVNISCSDFLFKSKPPGKEGIGI
jgi:hypothetical protein